VSPSFDNRRISSGIRGRVSTASESMGSPQKRVPGVRARVDTAVIPAAGFGTRLRPLTLAIPKEMLPLGRAPVLQHVLLEARDAGIGRAVLVVSPGKEMIRAFFGDGARLGIRVDYALQPEMRGLGDALLRAEEWVDGRPFAVLFGDCVVTGTNREPSPLARLLEVHADQDSEATVLTEQVAPERVSRYGIVAPGGEALRPAFAVADIVEKPSPEQAPSLHAVAARWVLSAEIFRLLRETPVAQGAELNLTDAVRRLLREGGRVWAAPLKPGERRWDMGGWATWLEAAAAFALADAEHGPAIRRKLLEDQG